MCTPVLGAFNIMSCTWFFAYDKYKCQLALRKGLKLYNIWFHARQAAWPAKWVFVSAYTLITTFIHWCAWHAASNTLTGPWRGESHNLPLHIDATMDFEAHIKHSVHIWKQRSDPPFLSYPSIPLPLALRQQAHVLALSDVWWCWSCQCY